MNALLLALILVLLMGSIVLSLTCPGCGDLAGPILLLTGMMAVVLAVGLTERSRGTRGEKP